MVCFIEFIQSNAAEHLAASGPSPSSVQGQLKVKITCIDLSNQP